MQQGLLPFLDGAQVCRAAYSILYVVTKAYSQEQWLLERMLNAEVTYMPWPLRKVLSSLIEKYLGRRSLWKQDVAIMQHQVPASETGAFLHVALLTYQGYDQDQASYWLPGPSTVQ